MIHNKLHDHLILSGIDPYSPPTDPHKWRRLLDSISAYYSIVDTERRHLVSVHQRAAEEMRSLYDNLKRESEDELEDERNRLIAVTNALQSGICAFTFAGRALFLNNIARNYFDVKENNLSLEACLQRLSFYSDSDESTQIEIKTLLSVLEEGSELSNVHASIGTNEKKIPCRCNLTPLSKEGENWPYGFVLTFSDITSELAAETDKRLAASAFEANEAILICDNAGRILKTNSAFTRITGYSFKEVRNRNVRLLRDRNTSLDIPRKMIRSLRRRDQWEGEIYNRRKDGKIVPQWLSISAVRDRRNKVTHYVAHFTDITEWKEMESNLRNAIELAVAGDKAKTEFLTTLSHEVRTPINIVLGMADLLNETTLNNNQRHFLSTQRKAGSHLLHLIDEILNFVNADKQVAKQQIADFDVRTLISSVTDMFKAEATTKGIKLKTYIDEEIPPLVRSNPQHMRQVLINLLNNAFKFTSSGSVSIYLNTAKPQHLACAVSDTGIGIKQDDLERIFTPFTQVDNSLSRRHGGIGMGLAISKKHVENMGGKMWVDSTPGQGSTFFFTLQSTSADSLTEPQPSPETKIEMTQLTDEENPPLILIAEDSEDNAMLLELYLDRAGYASIHAINGEEAVSLYDLHHPDLVLMDIQMPGVDGYEATRRIREIEAQENIPQKPIIALTAHAMDEHKRQSIEAGCNSHLCKPISGDALLEQLSMILASRPIAHSE